MALIDGNWQSILPIMEDLEYTSVDRFGRVVIPKSIRDELGLEPGSELWIRCEEGKLVFQMKSDQPTLLEEDGILVFTGQTQGPLHKTLELVQQERTEQLVELGMRNRAQLVPAR